MLNNAIGQGEILVTPLQMAVMTGRIATGNGALSPHFFMGEVASTPQDLPFRTENLEWIRHTMGRVVDIGTGTKARLEAIEVAGKTGTAENPHGEDHAWFVCFAPASHPEVAMAIILENGGHGGAVAAPVAARWLDSYINWRDREEEER
jgi:cell division protein FtsI/penicillin-binding protein 2